MRIEILAWQVVECAHEGRAAHAARVASSGAAAARQYPDTTRRIEAPRRTSPHAPAEGGTGVTFWLSPSISHGAQVVAAAVALRLLWQVAHGAHSVHPG